MTFEIQAINDIRVRLSEQNLENKKLRLLNIIIIIFGTSASVGYAGMIKYFASKQIS